MDAPGIMSCIAQKGYALQKIEPHLCDYALDMCVRFHSLSAMDRSSCLVSPVLGIPGYMPSEHEIESLRCSGIEMPHWIKSLKRPRGYSSFDVVPTACTELLGNMPFLDNPKLQACEISTEQYLHVSSRLNEYATFLCESVVAHMQMQFDNSDYCKFPAAMSSYGLARFLKYSTLGRNLVSKEHTDYELLTIVIADGPGLEVQTPTGEWIAVEWKPLHSVIIPGDMFEVVSAGTIKATMHRVSVDDSDRHSVVFFKGPSLNFPIPNGYGGIGLIPRTFREHVFSMQIRSAPHLQDQLDWLSKHLDVYIPNANPFRSISSKAQ